MRRAPTLALCLALTACAHRATKPAVANAAANTTDKTAASVAASPAVSAPPLPSAFVSVGRVLSVDEAARTAIVEISPYTALPADLDGTILFARNRDLRPIARLQATPYLRGLTLGVRTLDGQPAAGDEVVLSAPPPPAAPPPAPLSGKPGARPAK